MNEINIYDYYLFPRPIWYDFFMGTYCFKKVLIVISNFHKSNGYCWFIIQKLDLRCDLIWRLNPQKLSFEPEKETLNKLPVKQVPEVYLVKMTSGPIFIALCSSVRDDYG